MKISTMSKNNLGLIRSDLNEAFSSICESYGINIYIGSINFDEKSFKCTLNGEIKNKQKPIMIEYRSDYECMSNIEFYHALFGYPIEIRNEVITLTKFKKNATKYPFIGTMKGRSGFFKFSRNRLDSFTFA